MGVRGRARLRARLSGRRDSRRREEPRCERGRDCVGDQALSGGSLFKLAAESAGPPHSPLGLRTHAIDINGWVVGARLHIHFVYSEHLHRRETMENLSQWFLTALRSDLWVVWNDTDLTTKGTYPTREAAERAIPPSDSGATI